MTESISPSKSSTSSDCAKQALVNNAGSSSSANGDDPSPNDGSASTKPLSPYLMPAPTPGGLSPPPYHYKKRK
ncbi:hypothetical protein BV25DRAFT_1914232 [Artomyces pyxidatus]|uniref:Uncharacterized protein n=1 Tax=Artomyces pyxidatus TaxID=48021 RepID=A0ACB8T7K2_9AGAM|nr:hypothetical protein BV25DRAFT_1914232 [Artomyces pyxidatus]